MRRRTRESKVLKKGKIKNRLLRLMAEIHDDCFKMYTQFSNAWFFPSYNGVKGFLGTDNIVFVALNPSHGRFPSRGDKLFYKHMRDYGFESAHITDVIKYRLAGSEYKKLKENNRLFSRILEKNIKWLKREIDILGGSVKIVGIGKEAYDILKKYFNENVVDKMLLHYSWVERYTKKGRINVEKRLRFRKAFIAIKKQIEYSNKDAKLLWK
jgi:hypothetical protein